MQSLLGWGAAASWHVSVTTEHVMPETLWQGLVLAESVWYQQHSREQTGAVLPVPLLKESDSINWWLHGLFNLRGQMITSSWQKNLPLVPGSTAPKPVLPSLNDAFWLNLVAGERNRDLDVSFPMKSLDLWWKHFANHDKVEKSLLWWSLILSLNFNFLCLFIAIGSVDTNSYRIIKKYFLKE